MKSFMKAKLLGLILATSVAVQAAPLFPDVPDNHWAKDAVAALAAKGLVEGYPDGTFKGDRAASRWETAMIVARLLAKMEQAHATFATKAELDEVRKLANALREELDALGVRVTNLEENVDRLDLRVTELERITFYGELHVRAGGQSFSNDGANSARGINPGTPDFINYHNIVGSNAGAGGVLPAPLAGVPNNYFITGVPTVTNWLTGTPLTNGTTFTTKALLGLNIKVSDDIDAGAEFAAYSSAGDQIVDAFWGISAPYQSNAFTGTTSTGFGAGGAFNQPLNNTPYTRMTLDNFWVKHKPSGTKLTVGSFGSTDFDGSIYTMMPNPNPTGPAALNSFGFQVVGKYDFEEGEKPLALTWEVMGTKLPDGNVSLVAGDSYYSHAEGGNIGLLFNSEKGKVKFNFLHSGQDANGGSALNTGLIQFPNLISQWVNPNGYFVGQINNAQQTSGLGTTGDIRPVPTTAGADGFGGGLLGIGPQSQTMYGISADYVWRDNEFKPHLYGEYSHSEYSPNKNSGYNVDGDLFRIGAGAKFFDEKLDVDVHYLSVDPTYDPFVLQYPTVGGLTQPNWRIPDLNQFWNMYSLHDTATYPHNREGFRVKLNWKFNENGMLAFHYGNMQQVRTSLQDVRFSTGSLATGIPTIPNTGVLGFSPGFTDPTFLALSPFTFAPSGGNAFGTALENPKGEVESYTFLGSHKWITDEEENRGVTLSGLYINNNWRRDSNLRAILNDSAAGRAGESQNYVDFTISGWNIGVAYDVTPDFEVKAAYTQLDVHGHIDPLGVYNGYAALSGNTKTDTWDVTQKIPELGFNWNISEKTSWDMNFKFYDMTDNISPLVTSNPTVPTLGVAAGTQLTSHPFNWSGVQVMTNYKLKF